MEWARALMEDSRLSELPMDFDTAYHHISRIDELSRTPEVPSESLDRSVALSTLSPDDVFRAADSIDVVITVSKDEQRRLEAAVLANDMYTSLIHAGGGNAAALTSSLGLTLGSGHKY